MRKSISWVLTAVMIVGCLLASGRGLDIVRYSFAGSTAALRPWLNVSGIAFVARENALTVVDNLSNKQQVVERRDEISGILSVRPMSADYWLSLAKMQQAAGDEPSKALQSLELSALTGPNEGKVAMHRGLFVVWQWQMMSSDLQMQSAKALSAIPLSENDLAWLKADLSRKPDAVRQQIRAALQNQHFPANKFARIGL